MPLTLWQMHEVSSSYLSGTLLVCTCPGCQGRLSWDTDNFRCDLYGLCCSSEQPKCTHQASVDNCEPGLKREYVVETVQEVPQLFSKRKAELE